MFILEADKTQLKSSTRSTWAKRTSALPWSPIAFFTLPPGRTLTPLQKSDEEPTTPDLWRLTLGRPQIDPRDLAEAVAVQADGDDLDYRTACLFTTASSSAPVLGECRFGRLARPLCGREKIQEIYEEEFDKIGLPSLKRRLMDKTQPERNRQCLEYGTVHSA